MSLPYALKLYATQLRFKLPKRLLNLAAGGLVAASLIACGGGGDALPLPVVSPPVSAGSITGFAATGRALPTGSSVGARCVSGSVDSTTQSDGSFTLPATGLQFPCLLRTVHGTGESQQAMYSVATAVGTVHITPLTHAIVLAGVSSNPAALFANPTPTAFNASVANLANVQTRLRQLLADQGLSTILAAVTGDFFSAPLRPPTATTLGDAHDQLLDAVAKRFGSTDALVHTLNTPVPEVIPEVVPKVIPKVIPEVVPKVIPEVVPKVIPEVIPEVISEYKGISARVDWSKCDSTPRPTDQGYVASNCNSNAVVLSNRPLFYSKLRLGTIDMSLSSKVDGSFRSGKCLLFLDISESNRSTDRPPWTGTSGAVLFLNGWDTRVINPATGMEFPGLESSGNYVHGFTVTAIGNSSGAQVVKVDSSAGQLKFGNGFLTEAALKGGYEFGYGTCLW